MNWIYSGLAASLLVLLIHCDKPPEYSNTPEIELVNLKFIDAESAPDTLRMSIEFRDGDGDLGLDENTSQNFPDHEKNYLLYSLENEVYKLNANPFDLTNWEPGIQYPANVVVKYKNGLWASLADQNVVEPGNTRSWEEIFIYNYAAKINNKALPARNDFVTPYNCTEWEVSSYTDNNGKTVRDTLAIEYNEQYYNIFVEFYLKEVDGTFALFDPTSYFKYPNCVVNVFNGRYPVLSKDLEKSSPLTGVMTYDMRSSAFIIFNNRILKLKVYILDRAFNKSNVIETAEFTLQSIQ